MPRREYWIWGGAFGFSILFAVIFMLLPPTLTLSPFAGDIIGSMIGFMLAISFAEIIKIDEKSNRAKKINEDIREEISDNLETIDTVQHTLASDIWEMALSTGDIGLLDSDTRRLYNLHYRHVRYHRSILETMSLTEPVAEQIVIDKHRELMLASKEIVVLTGEHALKEKEEGD